MASCRCELHRRGGQLGRSDNRCRDNHSARALRPASGQGESENDECQQHWLNSSLCFCSQLRCLVELVVTVNLGHDDSIIANANCTRATATTRILDARRLFYRTQHLELGARLHDFVLIAPDMDRQYNQLHLWEVAIRRVVDRVRSSDQKVHSNLSFFKSGTLPKLGTSSLPVHPITTFSELFIPNGSGRDVPRE